MFFGALFCALWSRLAAAGMQMPECERLNSEPLRSLRPRNLPYQKKRKIISQVTRGQISDTFGIIWPNSFGDIWHTCAPIASVLQVEPPFSGSHRTRRAVNQEKILRVFYGHDHVRRARVPTTSLITFCSFLPFVQRPAHEILRRFPSSCQIVPTVGFWRKQRRGCGKRAPFSD